MAKKKKLISDRVMIEFGSEEAAEAFFNYIKNEGFDHFIENDHVHNDLGVDLIPSYISSDEEPMEGMDFYFLQFD